jgi:hypothetical protein
LPCWRISARMKRITNGTVSITSQAHKSGVSGVIRVVGIACHYPFVKVCCLKSTEVVDFEMIRISNHL